MALYDRPGSIHMSSALIRHVSDDSFEQDVLQADSAVLVDFWAEWCGPCKMVAPILDEIAGQYDGRGIPTLMIFKAGQLVATKVGALPKAQLTAFIDSHL